jgi:uncharacterized membrane protein
MSQEQDRGFLATLFDFSFNHFVTPGLLKLLYSIGLVMALYGAIRFIGAGFERGFMSGLGTLLLSPVLFLVYSLLARVVVELVMVLFRIADHVQSLAVSASSPDAEDAPPAPPPSAPPEH